MGCYRRMEAKGWTGEEPLTLLDSPTHRETALYCWVYSLTRSAQLYVNTVDFLAVKCVIQFLRFFQNVPPLTIVIKSMQAWCGVTMERRSSVVGPANIPQSGDPAFLECRPTDV